MSWKAALDRALDGHGGGAATLPVERGAEHGELDVDQVAPMGARLRELRLRHGADRDVDAEASRLAREVHGLGAALVPVEVDRRLGGAVLRTRPEASRSRGWFDVTTTPGETRVRRMRRGSDGTAESIPFDLTREQLGDLLDTLDGSG